MRYGKMNKFNLTFIDGCLCGPVAAQITACGYLSQVLIGVQPHTLLGDLSIPPPLGRLLLFCSSLLGGA